MSHIFVLFFSYAWTGPHPIQNVRTFWVFYSVYGVVCCVWWGVFGTLQMARATITGFQACFITSPSLYLMSQYEVTVFWMLLISILIFCMRENVVQNRRQKEVKFEKDKEEKIEEAKSSIFVEEEQKDMQKRYDSEEEEEDDEIVEFDRDRDLKFLDSCST